MSVLSDVSIQQLIRQGELITGGHESCARGCAYEFKAARVVYGGTDPTSHQVAAVDLTSSRATTAVIKPSGVVWVRSREQVKIPSGMVGIWVQTNSLSRSGLLLLNSTLVEPGYEGHLAAHFVNLGATDVLLSSKTTIAKLVFLRLDGDAKELIDSAQFQNYDVLVDSLAASSNRSFLRIAELVPDLKNAVTNTVSDAQRQISAKTDESIANAKAALQELERKTLIRVGGGFVVGFALAIAFAIWIYPILRNVDTESKDRILAVVKEQNAELVSRLDRLQEDVKGLGNGRGAESGNAPPSAPKK